MPEAASVRFAAAARLLAGTARARGLLPPAFRSPPRSGEAQRTIRRRPGGAAVVAVQVRGRPFAAVVADMVEGVIVANGLSDAAAKRTRSELLAAAAPLLDDEAHAA